MQADLFTTRGRAGDRQGVGARQGNARPLPQGGGSPPSCNGSELVLRAEGAPAPAPRIDDRDPRIEELRQMGLGAVWVRVAEAIGYETFVTAWNVMSLNRDFMDKRNRLTIPDISLLHHYNRAQMIRELAAQGMVVPKIQQAMLERTGEALTKFQVMHVLRRTGEFPALFKP